MAYIDIAQRGIPAPIRPEPADTSLQVKHDAAYNETLRIFDEYPDSETRPTHVESRLLELVKQCEQYRQEMGKK